MLSSLDPASQLFLSDVDRIQRRIADANRQVTSGKKMSVASDQPDEIAPLLQLRAERQRNSQIQSNLTLAKTDAGAADNALNSALKLMDRALTLASQGSSPTVDKSGRQSLAAEVRSLQQQLVACSQTNVQGRYIFSGDSDQSPSYSYDATAVDSVVQLVAAPATSRIQDPAGGSFTASKAAIEVFDLRDGTGAVTSGNVFAALEALRQGLEKDDTDAVAASVAGLKAASDHLNNIQATYGTVQNRIQNAVDFAGRYDTQLQTEISDKEDADVAAGALEMTQANTQLQAAFQMRARLQQHSLFDYLS